MQSSVNLLPAAATERFQKSRSKRRWCQLLSGTAVCVLAVIVVGQWFASRRDGSSGDSPGVRHSRTLQGKNQELNRKIQICQLVSKRQKHLRSAYSPLPVLAVLSEIKQRLDGRLELESFDFSAPASTASDKGRKPKTQKPDEHGHVSVSIRTDSPGHSAEVVRMLNESGMFSAVKLQSGLEQSGSHGDLIFTLRLSF